MSTNPYPINITLYDTDGSTVATSKLVVMRNGTTSETSSGTTNGSGEVILDASNFDSGYTNSDVLTIWSTDGDKTVYTTHTIDTGAGSHTTTLTYIDLSGGTTVSLRYFTASQFREFYNIDEYNSSSNPAGLKTSQIERIGAGVELEIDRVTKSKFDNNDGSYYAATDEYHDVNYKYQKDFFSRYGPIIDVSKFEVNTEVEGATASYTNLDATDYVNYWSYDSETGKFRIEDSAYYPSVGPKQVRMTYTYGMATVPNDIKSLAMLMTARQMAQAGLMSLAIKGTEMEGSGSSINILRSMDNQIESLLNHRMRIIAENV